MKITTILTIIIIFIHITSCQKGADITKELNLSNHELRLLIEEVCENDKSQQDFPGKTIIHVPKDQKNIQTAIDNAKSGDIIIVNPGRYYENLDFKGKNITLASRYLLKKDISYILNTIIDGSNNTDYRVGSCIRLNHGESSNARISGFTLTGGHGIIHNNKYFNDRYKEGGAIFIEDSSPTITHNLITLNEAVSGQGVITAGGGGINVINGSPTITNNIIIKNEGRYGAGIAFHYARGEIIDNIISANIGGKGYGGSGIWLKKSGPVTITGNLIIGNHSAKDAGGLYIRDSIIEGTKNLITGNSSVVREDQIVSIGDNNQILFTETDIAENLPVDGTYHIGTDKKILSILYKLSELDTK